MNIRTTFPMKTQHCYTSSLPDNGCISDNFTRYKKNSNQNSWYTLVKCFNVFAVVDRFYLYKTRCVCETQMPR